MSTLAIGMQFVRNVVGESKAVQVLVIPALGQTWSRAVSDQHPRGRWGLDAASSEPVEDFSEQLRKTFMKHPGMNPHLRDSTFPPTKESLNLTKWHLAMDVAPMILPVGTEDVADILTSKALPRNITLRFHRGITDQNVNPVGMDAPALEELVLSDPSPRGVGSYVVPESIRTYDFVVELINGTARVIRTQDDAPTVLRPYIPESSRTAAVLREPYRTDYPMSVASLRSESAPAALPDGVTPGTKLTRPNGQVYIARRVDTDIPDLSDIDLFRRSHKRGAHILAFGEPGTGKSASFEVAFPGLITMIGTAETEADHFIGSYTVTLGADGHEALMWEDGPLIQAMEAGVPLFVDEIGVIPPNQLTVLFSVMDGRGEIRVTANPARGVVKAKEGFGIIAATNPNAPGVRLSEALLSRFGIKVEIGTDYSAARKLKVNRRMVDAAEHLSRQCSSGEASWAPQMRELLQFRDDEEDIGLVFALRNLLNNVPEMERDIVQEHLQERFGDIVSPERIVSLNLT